MKLVLDANVIIAAFATRGLCHSLLELCLYDHIIFLSEDLLNEIIIKLKKKIKLPGQVINEIVFFLKAHTRIVAPPLFKERVCRDKDGDKVIGLAVSTKSYCIISEDNDFLVLKRYNSIQILSPRQFWNILRKQPKET